MYPSPMVMAKAMALFHSSLLILFLSLAAISVAHAATQLMYEFNVVINNRLQPFKCDNQTPLWCVQHTVDWYGSLLDRATGSVGLESRVILIFDPPSPVAFTANLTLNEANKVSQLVEVTDLYDPYDPPPPSVAPSVN